MEMGDKIFTLKKDFTLISLDSCPCVCKKCIKCDKRDNEKSFVFCKTCNHLTHNNISIQKKRVGLVIESIICTLLCNILNAIVALIELDS